MTKNALSIPIAVSARHVHLTEEHIAILFGQQAKLTFDFDLSQPGQFAAKERVVIKGPKGEIEKVRVLGPARVASQVEVSKTDSFLLGVSPPIRLSGDVENSEAILIIGPFGEVQLKEGLIIAKAHIHMHTDDALNFQVSDGELVDVIVDSERPITFHQVVIRVSPNFKLEMHIDTDEGNASNLIRGYGHIRKLNRGELYG